MIRVIGSVLLCSGRYFFAPAGVIDASARRTRRLRIGAGVTSNFRVTRDPGTIRTEHMYDMIKITGQSVWT